MYVTHNNQTYERVRMLNTSSSVRFVGESLPELEALTGLVMVFSESGFELRAFDPADYLRQEIIAGSWPLSGGNNYLANLKEKTKRGFTHQVPTSQLTCTH